MIPLVGLAGSRCFSVIPVWASWLTMFFSDSCCGTGWWTCLVCHTFFCEASPCASIIPFVGLADWHFFNDSLCGAGRLTLFNDSHCGAGCFPFVGLADSLCFWMSPFVGLADWSFFFIGFLCARADPLFASMIPLCGAGWLIFVSIIPFVGQAEWFFMILFMRNDYWHVVFSDSIYLVNNVFWWFPLWDWLIDLSLLLMLWEWLVDHVFRSFP